MKDEKFIKEVESFAEFKLVEKVVKGQRRVQDACHPGRRQEAVNFTLNIFSAAGKGHDWLGLGDSDYGISLSTLELAQRLEPSKQTKLVEFITRLHGQVAINPSTTETLKSQGSAFCADMPTSGYTER